MIEVNGVLFHLFKIPTTQRLVDKKLKNPCFLVRTHDSIIVLVEGRSAKAGWGVNRGLSTWTEKKRNLVRNLQIQTEKTRLKREFQQPSFTLSDLGNYQFTNHLPLLHARKWNISFIFPCKKLKSQIIEQTLVKTIELWKSPGLSLLDNKIVIKFAY